MFENIELIVKNLKTDTNNLEDIIYRKKRIHKKNLYIIYNEPLTSSDKISNFIMRSLNNIENKINKDKYLIETIENNISNFKIKRIDNYKDLCFHLHLGFTIILVEDSNYALSLETKEDNGRSVTTPEAENTIRGAKDAFIEEYQRNIGLIKKRIKTNDLWIETTNIGKYTNTKIGILSINGVVKKELLEEIILKLKRIDIDGINNAGVLKNLIEKENKNVFPTIHTTERPDVACDALLMGKIVIVMDNSPFVLIMPTVFNDFFKTEEDYYGKSINVTFVRTLKYMAFFIALMVPSIYIALITYNQEMIPTELLISFAVQREGVPFPAFFEALMMIISFEIIRECDLRVPGFTGSALSIVGALILGEAAVSAGIVSPIMIIIIAITAISSLPFTEPEITSGLRWYRLLFMAGASFLGIIGVLIVFIYFLIKMVSLESFGVPYLAPYAPTNIPGLKDSIFKASAKKLRKRQSYLSNNITREVNHEED